MNIIFSITKDSYNMQDNIDMVKFLNRMKLEYRIVDGCYKGQRKISYMVTVHSVEHELLIREICRKYNQESYLIINEANDASLVYLNDTKIEHIGTFREVSLRYAKSKDAYTFDRSSRKYYVAS